MDFLVLNHNLFPYHLNLFHCWCEWRHPEGVMVLLFSENSCCGLRGVLVYLLGSLPSPSAFTTVSTILAKLFPTRPGLSILLEMGYPKKYNSP